MKLKIILIVLVVYMIPGIYFSKEYGYFNKSTWQKIDGDFHRNHIVDVISASYDDMKIHICLENELRGKSNVVGISLPVNINSEERGRYQIIDHIRKAVIVPSESINSHCLKDLEKKLPIQKIEINETDRSYAYLRFEKIENKITPSIYVYMGEYSSVIVNMNGLDDKFDNYFVEIAMEKVDGAVYWYLILLFAFIADCLTYPFQYYIYVHVGIA